MPKLQANSENYAVPATLATAGVKADSFVKITGNQTVDMAVAGDVSIGTLIVSKSGDLMSTVETRFTKKILIKAAAALTAGTRVKIGAPSAGEQTVTAMAAGDAENLCVGVVWIGGANGAMVEILSY